MAAAAWAEVRCPSPDCDRADRGGRLLFRYTHGAVVHYNSRGSKLLVAGDELRVVAKCKCGYLYDPERDAREAAAIDRRADS